MADKTAIHPALVDGIQSETETTSTHRHEAHLNGKQLRSILGLPCNARISVAVPGGGDWSHTTLDLDDGHTLDIYWEVAE